MITGCMRISKESIFTGLNHLNDLNADGDSFPRPYWVNTSSNEIIRGMVERADRETREQIEELLAGGSMEIAVHEEITYGDMTVRKAFTTAFWLES